MSQGNITFLTNKELIAQLTLRDDLTALEHQLLDRLILATDECERLEGEVSSHLTVSVSGEQPS